MKPSASLDFGSNTVGYLIGGLEGDRFLCIDRASEFMRLAEGVRDTGVLSDAAIDRTLTWVEEIARRLRSHGVERVRAVGTEALRIASNGSTLTDAVERILGTPLEVISGEDEAVFTFEGVRLGYPRGPLAVLDIGGGSAELTVAAEGGEPACVSLPLGAVVLTEAHGEDWATLVPHAAELLARAPLAPHGLAELTVVGGNGANVAMVDQDADEPTDEVVEGHVVAMARVHEIRDRIRACSPEQRVDELHLPPRRADIVVAALAVLESAAQHLGIGALRSSRFSLRHGVLRSLLRSSA